MLKRLGPLPCWRGEKRFVDVFSRFYERAMSESRMRLEKLGESVDGERDEKGESL